MFTASKQHRLNDFIAKIWNIGQKDKKQTQNKQGTDGGLVAGAFVEGGEITG